MLSSTKKYLVTPPSRYDCISTNRFDRKSEGFLADFFSKSSEADDVTKELQFLKQKGVSILFELREPSLDWNPDVRLSLDCNRKHAYLGINSLAMNGDGYDIEGKGSPSHENFRYGIGHIYNWSLRDFSTDLHESNDGSDISIRNEESGITYYLENYGKFTVNPKKIGNSNEKKWQEPTREGDLFKIRENLPGGHIITFSGRASELIPEIKTCFEDGSPFTLELGGDGEYKVSKDRPKLIDAPAPRIGARTPQQQRTPSIMDAPNPQLNIPPLSPRRSVPSAEKGAWR